MSTSNPIFVDQSLNIDFTVLDENKVAVDITGATISFVLRAKGFAKKERTPQFIEPTDGQLRYVTIPGDLDEPGEYEAQCIVVLDGATYPSSIVEFEVLALVE